MRANIRFYIKDAKKNEELKELVKEASCARLIEHNYIQFTDNDGFILTQIETFFSDNLLKRLNELSSKVTLFVHGVEPRYMIEDFKTSKIFHTKVGSHTISGTSWIGGKYNLLFASTTSSDVLNVFRAFVPGIFYNEPVEIKKLLTGMNWFRKLYILFT